MKWLAHPTDGADGGCKLANVPELTADQWTELVERITLHASFEALRRLHWRGVSGSLGGKTPGGIEAADLAQWAIVDVIEGKRTWNPQADPDFLKFLQGVVDSKVSHLVEGLENRKSRRLGSASAGDESSDAYDVEASGPSPAELVANRDSAEKFQSAVIKSLEGDDLAYKVLECLEAEYTKPSEIAEMLGISVADVNKRAKAVAPQIGPTHQWQEEKVNTVGDFTRFQEPVWDRFFDLVSEGDEHLSRVEVQEELKRRGVDVTRAVNKVQQALQTSKAKLESNGAENPARPDG